MATWNVDRQKGGTYSFKLDAQGNYVLHKDGFDKVKTLNLPELKKEKTTTTTTTTKDTKTASAQTKEAFGDVQPFYYQGGGKDASQYTTEYQMTKDKSLDTNQSMTTGAWDKGKWGPKPDDSTPMTTTGDGPWTMRSGKADTTPAWAKGVDKRGYENIGKDTSVKATDQISRSNVDQVLAARAQTDKFAPGKQWGPKPSKGMPITPSDRQPGFEIANKRVSPQKAKVSETALKAVNTASNVLSKAVGFVMDNTLIGKALSSIKETPTNKHDKSYFNVNEDGRIAGNASTDLYAGMNRVSMSGNLEKAGTKRIETREKTIERKGYKKGDKFYDDTQKMKDQQKEYRASKNKAAVKAAVKKGASIQNPNEMRSAGNGGGGGGRVICTELHSTGEMSTVDWVRDTRFTFKTLTKSHVKGYLFWAIPTVRHMKKYPLYRKIWKHIAQHRANDIAWRLGESKFDLLGRIYAGIGEPTCWLIGKFVSDKQYNELNLKNWRKA